MKRFEVMFTLPNMERDSEDFTSKARAMRFAKAQVRKGGTKVFLDTFTGPDTEDCGDLIDYEEVV